ncbi:LysR family transcriptional regulator [Aliagarivorans taiwanensis]|uniref:LysR family transcriptional regulator n=1 Tax=Aliagarivorans taiwanensis TaxID=561966 RepID=UPI000409DF5E|nr:LysR family transcriptional regulator [Aliagarivorans taiwanensis]
MDKLETMRVFVEVARQQSFVNAAHQLSMTSPKVTRCIADLESRLGVKLFNRTTRLVRLTEPGTRFLQDSKQILEALEEAEAAVSGVYSQPKGKLTVTAPVLFGQKYVTPLVSEYLEQHQEVRVEALFYDRLTSMLEEQIDVAVRIGHLKDSGLYASQVGQVRRMICGSPDYFAKYGVPTSPEQLAAHRIIFPINSETSNVWQFAGKGKKQAITLKPQLRCNQNAVALNAAVQGFGITRLMSYQVAEELAKGSLISVLSEYEEAVLPIHVIHLEGRKTSAKIRAFIDLAVERLRANPFLNPSF